MQEDDYITLRASKYHFLKISQLNKCIFSNIYAIWKKHLKTTFVYLNYNSKDNI